MSYLASRSTKRICPEKEANPEPERLCGQLKEKML